MKTAHWGLNPRHVKLGPSKADPARLGPAKVEPHKVAKTMLHTTQSQKDPNHYITRSLMHRHPLVVVYSIG